MTDRELYRIAKDMTKMSYAPFSKFCVGAALECKDGTIYTGCNVENAAYGSTICAERCAVCKAVSEGARRFAAIAVVGSASYAWPCGSCRQVLNEFSPDMRVIAGQAGQGFEAASLRELLPHGFGPESL